MSVQNTPNFSNLFCSLPISVNSLPVTWKRRKISEHVYCKLTILNTHENSNIIIKKINIYHVTNTKITNSALRNTNTLPSKNRSKSLIYVDLHIFEIWVYFLLKARLTWMLCLDIDLKELKCMAQMHAMKLYYGLAQARLFWLLITCQEIVVKSLC